MIRGFGSDPESAGARPAKATFSGAEKAAAYVLKKLDDNLLQFGAFFPSIHSEKLRYSFTENTMWAHGFWTGMCWLAYDLTGDPKYRLAAEGQLETYERRFRLVRQGHAVNDEHELGMVYSPSCVSAYKMTGDAGARELALDAAKLLGARTTGSGLLYQHRLGPRGYRTAIDTVMNLPLLYWAYTETGEAEYARQCDAHVHRALSWHMRDDGAVYPVVMLQPDGEQLSAQISGFSSRSCWARGLAWGMYGLALDYSRTMRPESLAAVMRMVKYYCSRLPEDGICCWDLYYSGDADQRDSSSAAIIVCGMLELLRNATVAGQIRAELEQTAVRTLETLSRSYTSQGNASCNGVLLHGVYNLPRWAGVDECCLWGDYFYFEALVRCIKEWKPFW